jgi:hypothetical protein
MADASRSKILIKCKSLGQEFSDLKIMPAEMRNMLIT